MGSLVPREMPSEALQLAARFARALERYLDAQGGAASRAQIVGVVRTWVPRWQADVPPVLADALIELPRINYRRHSGRSYRFVYGAGNERSGDFIDNIVKVDVRTGEAVTWFEDGCYPGEPVFVASPHTSAEDDGVLLSVVLDVNSQRSFLLVLNAANLTELARAEAPHHIPLGFHGNYLAAPSGAESYRDLHR